MRVRVPSGSLPVQQEAYPAGAHAPYASRWCATIPDELSSAVLFPDRWTYGAGAGNRTLTGKCPTDFRISYGLRRLIMPVRGDEFVVWTIASPKRVLASGAARLVYILLRARP